MNMKDGGVIIVVWSSTEEGQTYYLLERINAPAYKLKASIASQLRTIPLGAVHECCPRAVEAAVFGSRRSLLIRPTTLAIRCQRRTYKKGTLSYSELEAAQVPK